MCFTVPPGITVGWSTNLLFFLFDAVDDDD